MRIVVTGATSMIGTALIRECIMQGDEILAIVRANTKRHERIPISSQVRVEYADLDSLENIQGDGKKYDVFYHFAWGYTSKGHRDLPLQQEMNIRATLKAVETAHRLGCQKFVGAGSQSEYGYVDGVINENTVCNPQISYGMAKLAASMLAKKMCEQLGLQYVWGRIFSVYGIHDHAETMIEYAIKQFLQNKNAEFSKATNIWNYLYETDAGKMFYYLGILNVDDGIYNIASAESRPLREYVEEIARIVNTEGKPCFALQQEGRSLNLNVDISKIITETGYVPQVDFAMGISMIIDANCVCGGG